jgi:hypothetical protein
MRSILLQLHVGCPVICEAWSNAPVAHGTQVTVYLNAPGGAAERLARHTHAALEREFARLGAYRGPAPCIAKDKRIYGAYTCAGAVSELVSRVLIYVADGTCAIDPRIQSYFSEPGAVIVPVVDEALATNSQTVLPLFMRTKLAERTTHYDPKPIITRLLRAIGVVASSVRLFISYRHQDASTVAGQLFHALAERGFAPFLDRFSSRPGDDFVDLISEELADKACLLSLETSCIRRSLYCRQEVATAVSRRMGLIAIDLPGSRQTFSIIQRRIDATKVKTEANGWLPSHDLTAIVDQIEQYYPHEALRRPRWQDHSIYNALQAANLRFTAEALGKYVVHPAIGDDRLLAMSAALPDTSLFIEVEQMCNRIATNPRGTIFGPLMAARSNRYREIDWLSRKSGIGAHDEGRLMRYVNRLKP